MTSPQHPEAHIQDIRRQLAEAQQVFNALEMQPKESLRDFEYRVKEHSDKLLSLKVAHSNTPSIMLVAFNEHLKSSTFSILPFRF